VKFVATKKGMTKKKIFHPSLFFLFLDLGSEMRDPGSGMGKNQDPGCGINILDPQHWIFSKFFLKTAFYSLDTEPEPAP
jgi:hypothetical protein